MWRPSFGSWIKERDILMCSVLVSVHGLKNEIYSSCHCACFGSWIKERDIFMCSVLVSVHGLKNEVYSCVACLFRFMD